LNQPGHWTWGKVDVPLSETSASVSAWQRVEKDGCGTTVIRGMAERKNGIDESRRFEAELWREGGSRLSVSANHGSHRFT
jgi:hypothetical protein